jgi:hypothetical protein
MVDDESGLVHYASEMVRIWDGTWRHHKNFETRQPQEFVRAKRDPVPLRHVRPEKKTAAVDLSYDFIGQTNIPIVQGPATHLYTYGEGIGEMVIEGSAQAIFRVR